MTILTGPVLETDRLTLRLPGLQDVPVLDAFLAQDRAGFIRPADACPGAALTWRAISQLAGMWALRGYGQFVFCAKGSDTALGAAGPWHPIHWPERELGWAIWDPSAEGKGYAFEATRAARDWAYDTLGWTTAVSYIDRDNSRSRSLAERLGCTLDAHAAAPAPDLTVWRHPAPEGRA
ncbi:MAG TPA: N-acetyltransferase [Aliiroseovarius sp.]|nr:N-acetyltransferase [Aliiroseovarius sp.]